AAPRRCRRRQSGPAFPLLGQHLRGAPTSRAWRSAPYARRRTARPRHGYADARFGFRRGTAPAFHSRRKQPAARHVRDEIYRAVCAAMAPFDALRSCASPSNSGPRRSKTNERSIAPHWSTSLRRLRRCVGAPSVCLPENVIPSAGATCASFQSTSIIAVLLPESFRGGCSFGVGKPISPPVILTCTYFLILSGLSYGCFSPLPSLVRFV